MQIQFWAATDVGRTRNHNEDNFLVDRKLNLFIVADGMGGHAAGEIASSVAVHEVRKAITEQRDIIDNYARSGSVLLRQPVLGLIERAISQACRQVHRLAQEDSERHGMGTTLSLLLISRGRGFVGHVGDSRIYMTRDGKARMVTEDHSVINELIKSGRLSAAEAHNSPYKNAVTRAVGVHATVEVDTFDFEILPGDNFLLCSDGLSGYLEEDEQVTPYLAAPDIKSIPQRLIDYANECGGKDNITAIIVRLLEEAGAGQGAGLGAGLGAGQGAGQGAEQSAAAHLSPPTAPPEVDLSAFEPPPSIPPIGSTAASLRAPIKGLTPAPRSPAPPAPPPPSVASASPPRVVGGTNVSQLPLEVLKLNPIFSFLDAEGIEELARCAQVRRVQPEQPICLQGEIDEPLVAVLSGELRLERGGQVVALLSPGDTLGEGRLLAREPNEVSAVSASHATLLEWDRHALYHLMATNSPFATRLIWGVAQVTHQRLRRLGERLEAARAALERESERAPDRAPLRELISLAEMTASALPAASGPRAITPKFILNLDPPPTPLFKSSLDESEAALSTLAAAEAASAAEGVEVWSARGGAGS